MFCSCTHRDALTGFMYESPFGAVHVTPAGRLICTGRAELEFKEHLSFLLTLDVAVD